MADIADDSSLKWRHATHGAGQKRSNILSALAHALLLCGVFLCSMVYFRPTAGNVTFSDLLFAAVLLLLFLDRKISAKAFGKMTVAVWLSGLFLLLGGLTISSLSSPDPTRAVIVIAQYAYAYLAVMLIFGCQNAKDMISLAKAYVLSMLVICFHGIYLIHFDGQVNTVFVTGSGRLSGLMERTNECATVIALCVPIVLALCTAGHLKKIHACFALAIMIYGILLTGSNSGLLSLVSGFGIFALVGLRLRRILAPLVLGATILTFGGSFVTDYLPTAFQKRVLGALESGDLGKAGTFDGRIELINEALELTSATMLAGVGADQYRILSSYGAPVHNLYLLLWTEGDMISAVGFVVMLLGALGPAFLAFGTPGGRPFAAAILANVTVFFIAANALPHVYSRFWVFPILLPLGLAASFFREHQMRRQRAGVATAKHRPEGIGQKV